MSDARVEITKEGLEPGVDQFTLALGPVKVTVLSYGATLTSLKCPDRNGVVEEVTVCHTDLELLRTKSRYFGCIAGRVANRIAGGKFELDGKTYSLAINNGRNALHGGLVGFDKRNWESKLTADGAGVEFRYVSMDEEEGYPGTLTATVTYTLERPSTAGGAASGYQLRIDYLATVEGAATPINLTNHAYWNLSGDCKRKITTHRLALCCPRYLPFDEHQIPVGEERPVEGTLFDFGPGAEGADTHGVLLADRVPLIDGAGQPGLDHCFCADRAAVSAGDLVVMATLSDPESGRRMQVSGTQPGVQVYSSNWLSQDEAAHPFTQHNALCLETQHYPDSINQPQFPSCVLRPGEAQAYKHTATFLFDTF